MRRLVSVFLSAAVGLSVFLVASLPARAVAPDQCLALAETPSRALVQRASLRVAQLKASEVRLSYIGHSTFLIESAAGVKIATDYNDYVRPREVPDIITMNRAHDTHHTSFPDPRIEHVLRGWNPEGGSCCARFHVPRRAGAQRAHKHSHVGRRHNALRQFNFRIRNCGPVHRPSRASPSHVDDAAIGTDRADGRRPSAGGRELHAGSRWHARGAPGAQGSSGHPDALFLELHVEPLLVSHRRQFRSGQK